MSRYQDVPQTNYDANYGQSYGNGGNANPGGSYGNGGGGNYGGYSDEPSYPKDNCKSSRSQLRLLLIFFFPYSFETLAHPLYTLI
jgi:hypothetical protein